MMLPPVRLARARRRLLSLLSAVVMAGAGVVAASATAHGQPPPPPPAVHNVKYTVFAEQPFDVAIYYRDSDPPNWADYSHNPYVYSPKAKARVGPDQQWVLDVVLANPDEWAMVTATSGQSTQTPNIHCVLAVDGVVVATDAGPKGALCSIRNW
ncbi:hypothetical protein [Mycolicibacterium holsaticum]|uniref:Secreted protein n=1 Tax=Mycolicibacterium holsaticum TaxID=152142 RepID=A0A1E3S1M6_9MYCO|nr:hypothetical protein BHQ17_02855 [Mycolicibacterium holsaticum]